MSLKFRSLVIAFVGLVGVFLFVQFPMWFLLVHREQHASFTQLTRGLTAKLRSSSSIAPSRNPFDDTPERRRHGEAFGNWELPSNNGDLQTSANATRGDNVHESIVKNALVVEELVYTSRARSSHAFELTIVAFSLDTFDDCTLPWHLVSEAIAMVTVAPVLVDILLVTSLPLRSGEHRDSSCWGVMRSFGVDPFTLEAVLAPTSVVRFRPLTVSQGGHPVSKQLVAANAWALVSQIITRVAPSVSEIVFLGPQVDIAEVDLAAIAESYHQQPVGSGGKQAPIDLLSFTLTIGGRISSAGVEVKRCGSQLVVAERLAGFNALDARGSEPKIVLWPAPAAFGASLRVLKSFWPVTAQVIPLQAPEQSAGSYDLFLPPHQTRPFLMFLTSALLSHASNGTLTTLQSGVRIPLQQATSNDIESPMPPEGGVPLIEVLEEGVTLMRGKSSARRSDIQADHSQAVNAAYHRVEEEFYDTLFPMNNSILLEWETFCIPCFGFTNEVMHFIVPLEEQVLTYTPHDTQCFCSGTPKGFQQSLARLSAEPPEKSHWAAARRAKKGSSHGEGTSPFYVLVSHKDPGSFPRFNNIMDRPDYVIGRAMYEFNKIPQPWLSHVVDVDEVWVPCRFVQWVFEHAGFPPEKLVVIPEPIDVFMYDPLAVQPIMLPPSSLDWSIASTCDEALPNTNGSAWPRCHDSLNELATNFKFFSVFKWEDRKGWEELLSAYLTEFSSEDKVSLYLVTYLYGEKDGRNPKSIMRKIREFVSRKLTDLTWPHIPHIVVIASQLTEQEMIAMYGSVDAFVLPTRGEGWGLPAIQAMSMALPTIVTNWSGIVDFATEENSYLIPVDSLEDLPLASAYGYETGKKWALPSVASLKSILRDVVANPEKAKDKGRRARRDVVAQFSDEAVAQTVKSRLRYLKDEHEKPVKDKLHEAVEAILEDRHLIV